MEVDLAVEEAAAKEEWEKDELALRVEVEEEAHPVTEEVVDQADLKAEKMLRSPLIQDSKVRI